jgi:hypothetical protein
MAVDHVTSRAHQSRGVEDLDDAIASFLAEWSAFKHADDDEDQDDGDGGDGCVATRRRGGGRGEATAALGAVAGDEQVGLGAFDQLEVFRPPPGYRRDRLGRWRYIDGGYVPGAADVTLGDLYRVERRRGRALVPVRLARGDAALAWCRSWPLETSGAIVCHGVDSSTWERAAASVVTLSAPELCAERLLDTASVAAIIGVRTRTVASYLARGSLPDPVARVGNSPVWTLPVLLRWMARRAG